MKYAISMMAVLAAVSTASAADLIVDEPAAQSVATASGIRGTIDVGVLGTYVDQDNEPFEGGAFGAYAGASIWGVGDTLVWGLDGYVEGNSFEDPYYEAPGFVGVIGGHLGFNTGAGSIGAFASVGTAPDDDNEAQWGYTAGVEGIAELGAISIFGQLGYGDIRVDGDDSGFTGPFGRVGLVYALSDDFAVLADLSAGSSTDYEDEGDPGSFIAAGVKAAYKLPVDFDAFLTAGYEFARYDAEDPNTGYTHTVKVGLSIPFGDDNSAATALNPLATSALPYRAASWGETLD